MVFIPFLAFVRLGIAVGGLISLQNAGNFVATAAIGEFEVAFSCF